MSDTETPPALSPGATMVANRLRKNLRHLGSWRRRHGIDCYRLYDADLPEYAAAVDVYLEAVDSGAPPQHAAGAPPQHAAGAPPQHAAGAPPQHAAGAPPQHAAGAPRRFAHVQEYQAPKRIPPEVTEHRLDELVAAVRTVLELPEDRVAVKVRARGKGGSKYGRMADRGETFLVREGAVRLEVNLFDYLDTGLFLDHRPIRMRLAREAQEQRLLNLFCYTGAATVHAAAGGAAATTSVDLSATYLDWARRNLAANGLDGPAHALVRADVLDWMTRDRGVYELIFCDPPTFSNSKRAADFDVQRQHVELLSLAMARLAPGGLLLFSNNFRRFKLDQEAVGAFAAVTEISRSTVDVDFARNPRIHRCWELRHRPGG